MFRNPPRHSSPIFLLFSALASLPLLVSHDEQDALYGSSASGGCTAAAATRSARALAVLPSEGCARAKEAADSPPPPLNLDPALASRAAASASAAARAALVACPSPSASTVVAASLEVLAVRGVSSASFGSPTASADKPPHAALCHSAGSAAIRFRHSIELSPKAAACAAATSTSVPVLSLRALAPTQTPRRICCSVAMVCAYSLASPLIASI
mmetsp:Transcript_35670/g.83229  ORF Transcript_35670/g.83229 Transcript_35670/m.83229 type:complete len:213 (-) Transcript_35670:1172-1810(-)